MFNYNRGFTLYNKKGKIESKYLDKVYSSEATADRLVVDQNNDYQ